MTNEKILISGFEPFGGSAINPTERLINDIKNESFADAEIRTVLLPVHYDECAELLLKEVHTFEPDAVIACGVAGGRTAVTPERIAINTKDVPPESVIADNRGRGRRMSRSIRRARTVCSRPFRSVRW